MNPSPSTQTPHSSPGRVIFPPPLARSLAWTGGAADLRASRMAINRCFSSFVWWLLAAANPRGLFS